MKRLLQCLLLLFLVGCNNPTKTINFLTPDRIGIGEMHGHVTGSTNFTQEWYDNGHFDANWDSTATIIWFEWDFPSWKEPTIYDAYLRDRVRTLNLEKDLLIEKEVNRTIY